MSDKMAHQRDFDSLLRSAHQYASDYIRTIDERAVAPQREALAGLAQFDEALPDNGADPATALKLLHDAGSPATVAQTGGRYFGFVNGGLHPPSLAAKWLADAWDQNSALQVMSPTVSKIEDVCERWLVDLFCLPEGTAAGFVSGTSMSLMCGIAAARNKLLEQAGWDITGNGLFGAPPVRVIVGEQAHSAVFKALSLLGLGSQRIERVACDRQGRMDPLQLPALDNRCLLILSAGNVNSGSFDPMSTLVPAAREAGAWVHIDGAFGLWAAASPSTWPLYAGAEHADSLSVDAHKTLNAPYDCGIILSRDRHALVSALQATGAYIEWSAQRDGMLYTPEMSRRARAVELWMVMKTMGRDGMARLVDQLCARARQFAAALGDDGFEILNDVVFNQVLVACGDDEETVETLREIQQSGVCWCGGSVWSGRQVIRISVCSHATTPADIDASVLAFKTARSAIREKRRNG